MIDYDRNRTTQGGDCRCDAAVRDSLRFLLEVIGHSVETFASAAEFLKADIRNIACLILDHHMPEMTGLELAERLRADGFGIPILLITGWPSPAIAAWAAELGIRVLQKPPAGDHLIDFIDGPRSEGDICHRGSPQASGRFAADS